MQLTRRFPKRLVLVALLGGLVASASVAQSSTRPQPLRGSRASVELMYTRAIAENLNFHTTPEEVYEAAVAGRLKLISFTEDVALDEARYPFVLPQTLDFITQLAAQYHAQCGERLVVTSGARPVEKQPRNAARESVHPTGMAVDFHRPAAPCLTWLRKALVELEDRGLVEATEERHPPHFHVAILQGSPTQYAVNVDLKGMKSRRPMETISNGAVASADTATDSKDSVSTATTNVAASSSTEASRTSEKNRKERAQASRPNIHRVKPGDNLWTIALRHHTTVKHLRELNHLRTVTLRAGQQLRLP